MHMRKEKRKYIQQYILEKSFNFVKTRQCNTTHLEHALKNRETIKAKYSIKNVYDHRRYKLKNK